MSRQYRDHCDRPALHQATDNARDEGRFAIAMLLGLWLVFFALAAIGSGLALAESTTAVSALAMCWCVVANLAFFGVGCRWVVEFVTGRK